MFWVKRGFVYVVCFGYRVWLLCWFAGFGEFVLSLVCCDYVNSVVIRLLFLLGFGYYGDSVLVVVAIVVCVLCFVFAIVL